MCVWLSLPLYCEFFGSWSSLVPIPTMFSGITSVSPIAAIHETWPPGRNIPQQPHHLALHSLSDLILGRKYLKYRPEDLEMLLLGHNITNQGFLIGLDMTRFLCCIFYFKCKCKFLARNHRLRVSFDFPEKVYAPSHSWGYTRSISLCGLFNSLENIVYIPRGLDPEQPRIEHKGNILPCYFVLQWEVCLRAEVLQDKPAPFGCFWRRNMMSIIWLLVLIVIVYMVQGTCNQREKQHFVALNILITQLIWLVYQQEYS